MKKIFILSILFSCTLSLIGQSTFPKNGVNDKRSKHYAFTNATIYKDYKTKIDNATLIIKDGKVVNVSASAFIPKGAVEVDCKGKTIYPSFVETISNYGLPEVKPLGEGRKDGIQQISDKKGAYHWNEAIKPEIEAHILFNVDDKRAGKYRELGYGSVVSHQNDGIARGSGALVSLGKKSENESILKDKVSGFYSFKKGVSKQGYPSALMGSIALLRQTYLDGEWYEKEGKKSELNISYQAWNELQEYPSVFLAEGSWKDILRADKVGDEYNVQYIIVGNGDEYKRLDDIKRTGAKLIVPFSLPDAYDVEDPIDAHYIGLATMKHWELAPYNLQKLSEANIDFALTGKGLKEPKKLFENLKIAIEKGLSEEVVLGALTAMPAKILGVDDLVGSLNEGRCANFLISSGNIFDDGAILENWIQGEPYVINRQNTRDLKGVYDLTFAGNRTIYKLEIDGKPSKPKMNILVDDTTKIKVKSTIKDNVISLSFTPKDSKGALRLSGTIDKEGNWKGRGQDADGKWIDWQVKNKQPLDKKKKEEEKKDEEKVEKLSELTYPFLPYGWKEKLEQEAVLFKNVTVWTNTDDGILENADVLIRDGRIAKVGKDLAAGGAKVIEGENKHLTSGIIDEHSHIAIERGVNEWTQASSAEVSIGDVVNSEDINIYRQLAGGVTTAQLLHGSANPIGGQSAIIKFRWGATPEEMKFENADGFIKFALGENVKHSNWGSGGTIRFPQTRLGVEQCFVDHFTRAKDYEKAKMSNPSKVRTDLEMETLLEIMNKKRFITCHSYVQSEITMLMRVAEQFGFTINTFTHILEGYKIADKMKEHGVYASTFSDWWAYKFEVNDAIPHNAAILAEMGVPTAINSDDAEMGRRLNTETAKAVKYGGASEEEAWKMVTLNPAKILHLDNRVGSIEKGKDADIVLWSGHPLSVYTVAEQTYVDGVCYWDIERDIELRKENAKERNRLIQKMIKAKEGGAKTQKVKLPEDKHYHCDSMEDEGN